MEMNGSELGFLAGALTEQQLCDKRVLFISEGITSAVAKRVVGQLLLMDSKSHEPITIYQNSPGGEVNSGFAIYDTIRFLGSTVRIVNTGLCASIATVINVACKKENRFSTPNTRFLIHQPLIPGQIVGQASDLEITAREILKTRERINKLLAEECKQDLAKVEKDTVRDYWMTAEEAVSYGLVSKIIRNQSELR
jgi:ATP-dependent Clp protease, protease subunit